MKLKFAFGFLPYILIEKDLGERTLGSSKYFVVWLDDSPLPTTDEHEEFHVGYWYTVSLLSFLAMWLFMHPILAAMLCAHVDPLLGTISKTYKRLEESFAYAYEASHHDRPQAYVDAIHRSEYHRKRYGADFGLKVRKRLKWFL